MTVVAVTSRTFRMTSQPPDRAKLDQYRCFRIFVWHKTWLWEGFLDWLRMYFWNVPPTVWLSCLFRIGWRDCGTRLHSSTLTWLLRWGTLCCSGSGKVPSAWTITHRIVEMKHKQMFLGCVVCFFLFYFFLNTFSSVTCSYFLYDPNWILLLPFLFLSCSSSQFTSPLMRRRITPPCMLTMSRNSWLSMWQTVLISKFHIYATYLHSLPAFCQQIAARFQLMLRWWRTAIPLCPQLALSSSNESFSVERECNETQVNKFNVLVEKKAVIGKAFFSISYFVSYFKHD